LLPSPGSVWEHGRAVSTHETEAWTVGNGITL
jgi:hypothetical protein